MGGRDRTGGARPRGRPPYGYRLTPVDKEGTGAPRPTDAHDPGPAWRLTPDETTAPVVRRIFREYLAGRGIYGIAETLTAEGVLCPSAHDATRNPHHGGVAWSKGAVRAILVNPRYARCDAPGEHAPLIDVDDFVRAQEQFDRNAGTGGTRASAGRYAFRGLLRCGACYRRMQGTQNNREPYYRCRYPARYADANAIAHPRNVYLRESRLRGPLNAWLVATCSWRNLRQLADSPPAGVLRQWLRELPPRVRSLPEVPLGELGELYESLRLRLLYLPDSNEVQVRLPLGAGGQVISGVVRL